MCQLCAGWQLGSSARGLNNKYPGSYLYLLKQWNRESYTIMLTVGMIIMEHPTLGVVLKFFRLAKSEKSIKTRSSFPGVMRDSVKERKDYSLEMYGSHDFLDAFPQSIANSSSTPIWL